MRKKQKRSCKDCEFWAKCASIVYGVLGYSHNIVSGTKKNPWCENWRTFDKQRRLNSKKK